MRQSELWSRYRFICRCERCSASPPTTVDHTLQEISSASLDASSLSSDQNVYHDYAIRRTSAAYSLLLAGATHHLFRFESSLIATVSNFWISAGDSLLTLSRSPVWSEFAKCDLPIANPPLLKCICSKCSLMDNCKAILFHREAQYADFEDISSEFLDCVTIIAQKVWSFLIHGCCYLRVFKDPIDFSWLGTSKYSSLRDVQPHLCSTDEEHGYTLQERMHIFQLGIHCLLYGAYLASICYGRHSHLTCQVQNILDREECLINDSHETD
ncbi:hypothetical protein SO802_024247 [Lithocarpus litseifolius]|uniref:Protein SET DOMAIN GROUP 41 n=1 Tax=Lithocarpus litseifolius TaxID=425828 RepID=A0AAW2CBM2_9ROSI